MNVLILTPGRCGSTFLQRLLTIYMLRRGDTCINPGDLTNGLEQHFHNDLNQYIVSGSPLDAPTYSQSLPKVTQLLKDARHTIVGRLGHFHLTKRNDPAHEQAEFYKYLNDNFYIIAARRENILEYALSWIIRSNTKVPNVHLPEQKVEKFDAVYKNKITATQSMLIKKLNEYHEYVIWSEKYFDPQSYFMYETHAHNIEDYILNLDFMRGHTNNRWDDMFDMEFDTWNKVHKTLPDSILSSTAEGVEVEMVPQLTYQSAFNQMPMPVDSNQSQAVIRVAPEVAGFLKKNVQQYVTVKDQLDMLVEKKFMDGSVPIKLQTWLEKQQLFTNFESCINWYNEWAIDNNYNTLDNTKHSAKEELLFNDFSNCLVHKPH